MFQKAKIAVEDLQAGNEQHTNPPLFLNSHRLRARQRATRFVEVGDAFPEGEHWVLRSVSDMVDITYG